MQCRACMQLGHQFVNMTFVVSKDNKTLYDYYNVCTQLNASPTDKLPNTLCSKCSEAVQAAFTFRRKALKSDKKFRDALEKAERGVKYSHVEEQIEDLEEIEAPKHDPLYVSELIEHESVQSTLSNSSEVHDLLATDIKTEPAVEICDYKLDEQIVYDNSEKLIQDVGQNFGKDNLEGSATHTKLEEQFESDNDTDNKTFDCTICERPYKRKKSLRKHIRTKHPEADLVSILGTTKQRNSNAECETIRLEEGEKEYPNKLLSTQISDQQNDDKSRLKMEGKYICSVCPREFSNERVVKAHERYFHFREVKMVECTLCQKKFKSSYIKTHVKVVHNSKSKITCDICGNSFKSHSYLKSHKLLHSGGKFPCTICGKKLVHQIELKVHMRYHTGEEPFACNLCDKRFKTRAKLNYHMDKHVGFKRKCKECGKEFNSVAQLKVHSYKHTGMPYRCFVCNYGCPLRDVLRKHLLRVHNKTITDAEYNAMFKANTGRNPFIRTAEELQSEAVETKH